MNIFNRAITKFKNYVAVGILTLLPIWATVFVLDISIDFLNKIAEPLLKWVNVNFLKAHPELGELLFGTWIKPTAAIIFLLIFFYVIGWFASWWLGGRVISLFDTIINKIPLAKSIYNSAKRLTDVMKKKPEKLERVVLIDFPNKDTKSIGLVTQTFNDPVTNDELAIVFVPTSPNPTGGYMQVVKTSSLIPLPWKVEQAMSFVISGGADLPSKFSITKKD